MFNSLAANLLIVLCLPVRLLRSIWTAQCELAPLVRKANELAKKLATSAHGEQSSSSSARFFSSTMQEPIMSQSSPTVSRGTSSSLAWICSAFGEILQSSRSGGKRNTLDKVEDTLLIFAAPLLWSTLLFHVA